MVKLDKPLKTWKIELFLNCLNNVSPGNKKIKKKNYLQNGKIPIIDQGKDYIGGYTNDTSKIQKVELPAIIFGDHTRRFKFIDFPFAVGADGTKILKINKEIANPKFIYYQLLQSKLRNKGYSRHFQFLKKIHLKIPIKKGEQNLIVQAIETQLTRLESVIKSLKSIKKKLDIYRKSVLKTAFNLEGKYKKISSFCEVVSGSTPRTTNKEYWSGDICWITPKDLSEYYNKYIEKTSRTITQKGYNSCSTTIIPPNNVLMSSRAPIGYLVINKKEICTNQGFKSFKIKEKKILNTEFLYYQLKFIVNKIKNEGSGTTFNEISKTKAENILIKVPSIKAQESIVRKIESRFSMIDKIEQVVGKSLKKANQLKKSILKSAFGGELVSYKGGKNE